MRSLVKASESASRIVTVTSVQSVSAGRPSLHYPLMISLIISVSLGKDNLICEIRRCGAVEAEDESLFFDMNISTHTKL